MTVTTIGLKGQIVIQKSIRDRFGVKPGWRATQRAVGDHVEIRFLPPRHNRSLRGILAPHLQVHVSPGADWDRAREQAWAELARQSEATP